MIKFCYGDSVEIQRDVGSPWELVTYDSPGLHGWHKVKLPSFRGRIISAGTGYECRATQSDAVYVEYAYVPSVRIRSPRP